MHFTAHITNQNEFHVSPYACYKARTSPPWLNGLINRPRTLITEFTRQLLHCTITTYLLGPKFFFRAPFSNILNVHLSDRETKFQTLMKLQTNIRPLHLRIFLQLGSHKTVVNSIFWTEWQQAFQPQIKIVGKENVCVLRSLRGYTNTVLAIQFCRHSCVGLRHSITNTKLWRHMDNWA
jgi:hypothetical protein